MPFHAPEKFRIKADHPLASSQEANGNNGIFVIKLKHGQTLFAMAGDGLDWEHVSVSRRDRCPTWEEMCQVKALFWDADDCVVQYHPPASEYVNNHPYCLHLWRRVGMSMPMPPSFMVGTVGAAK